MSRHPSFPTRIIGPVAGAMLIGTLTPLLAHADDPLQPIRQTIERDRKNHQCPNSGTLSRDMQLEKLAQDYARHEDQVPLTPPPGYNRLLPFLGAGDPQAQAITRTYDHGARQIVGSCAEYAYGVGFIRHEERSVDVVTIVFGELTAPNHPASISLKPGQGSFYISGSGFSRNTTVSVIYNYFPGRGVTTNSGKPSKVQVDSKGNFATIVYVSTLNAPGRLDVEAEDSGRSFYNENHSILEPLIPPDEMTCLRTVAGLVRRKVSDEILAGHQVAALVHLPRGSLVNSSFSQLDF